MHPPEKMIAVIEGKSYNVATSELLCGDDWYDGYYHERSGRNTFLYLTPRGAYFFVHLTTWLGEHDSIQSCTESEADEFYEDCAARDCARVPLDVAFPTVAARDAS